MVYFGAATLTLSISLKKTRGKVDVKVGNGLVIPSGFPYHLLNIEMLTAALSLSVLLPPLCFNLICRFKETSVA